jgi:hypothetical protein
MNISYKLALLAALGLAGTLAAQAQSINSSYVTGDLLVGVYDPTVANTEVVDIGSFSSLQNGETWDLSSLLTSAGFSSTLNAASQFGVVGYQTVVGSTGDSIYSTDASQPPSLLRNTRFTAMPDVNTLGLNEGAQLIPSPYINPGVDWYSETLAGSSSTLFADIGYQVNATVGNAAQLWTTVANNSTPSQDSTFTLNPSTEVLTYGTVPEPSTLGLFGGAGVLLLAFRNKFSRKQA